MKKRGMVFVFSLLFLVLFLNSAKSQVDIAGISSGQFSESVINISTHWQDIGKAWGTMLMGNPTIKAIDSFLQKMNFVFVILFGVDYSLSLSFLFVIILWVLFLFAYSTLFSEYASFSKGISFAISVIFVIIMAQLKWFVNMSNSIMLLFFGEKPWWVKLAIGLAIIIIITVILILYIKFGKYIKLARKKIKDEKKRIDIELGAKAGESLSKAMAKAGK